MNKLLFIVSLLVLIYSCEEAQSTAPSVSYHVDAQPFSQPDTKTWPGKFNIGRTAKRAEIDSLDIDVRADGLGLPDGSGTVAEGKNIYIIKCAACHGLTGREGPQDRLVGAFGDTSRRKTIGNYWPYATTLFDYIRRAMPYNAPGSLSNDEVYSLSAYLLHANGIIDSTITLDEDNLAGIVMPAKKLFVNDDRVDGKEIR